MRNVDNEWVDAGQEAHDEWLRKKSDEDLRRLARGLNRLMRLRTVTAPPHSDISTELTPSGEFDAVARAVTRHPRLTTKEAKEMAEAFGF